jgi:hypothetical protein
VKERKGVREDRKHRANVGCKKLETTRVVRQAIARVTQKALARMWMRDRWRWGEVSCEF